MAQAPRRVRQMQSSQLTLLYKNSVAVSGIIRETPLNEIISTSLFDSDPQLLAKHQNDSNRTITVQ